MPYKPTGRPPGRPRKQPPTKPVKTLSRARKAFREARERLVPSPAIIRFGKRPRRKPSSQSRIA